MQIIRRGQNLPDPSLSTQEAEELEEDMQVDPPFDEEYVDDPINDDRTPLSSVPLQQKTVDEDEPDSERESEDVQDYFDDPNDEFNLQEIVRRFCLKYKLTYRAVADLLKIFNGMPNKTVDLPKSYVTLMHTPRDKIVPKYVPPGQYYHFGLNEVSKELDKIFNSGSSENVKCNLSVHIDGVALSDSSSLGTWAIAGSIEDYPDLDPFLIGVYVGYGQPSDFDAFLEDFAADIHIGHTTGFTVAEKQYFYDLKYIVADAPARSKLTHTMGHGALKGCPFCSQIGFKEPDIGTQYAPQIVLPLRTDEAFKLRIDEEHFQKSHRKKKGVLETKCDLPMVTKVAPCGMHSYDHGAMKKVLKIVFGKKGFRGHKKFSKDETMEISNRYVSLKPNHLCDFTRTIRSLQENFNLLKAVECRYILLYYGFLIFRDIFTDGMYQNFLCLSMAARLLADPNPTQEALDMAQNMLQKFVEEFSIYYGFERTYVIHTLLHFVPYVKMYGPLYSFSSYKFENYYRIFKGLVRAKHHVIQQIRNRVTEGGLLKVKQRDMENDGLQLNSFVKRVDDVDEYSSYIVFNTTFRTDEANCFAMIKDPNHETGTLVVKIIKFKRYEGGVVEFEYQHIKQKESFFKIEQFELESTDFDIFVCESTEESTIHQSPTNIILYKLISTPLYWRNNERVMQRLIHSTK